MSARVLVLTAVLVAACGDNQPPVEDMAVPADMAVAVDLTPPPDLRMPLMAPDFGAFSCGGMMCSGSDQCCLSVSGAGATAECRSSCVDAGAPVECQYPGHCGGNPCCTRARVSQSAQELLGVECAASKTECEPSFAGDLFQTRLCASSADCSDGIQTSFNRCCFLAAMGQGQFLCLDPTFAQVLGAPCL